METLVVSLSRRCLIQSEFVTDERLAPVFYKGDNLELGFKCVSETYDPTAPTSPVTITGSSGVRLTDGFGTIYAAATIVGVTGNNQLNITLVVQGTDLDDALAIASDEDRNWINAVLEVRATVNTFDALILYEGVTIKNTVTV